MKQLRDSIDSPSSDHYNKFLEEPLLKKKKKKTGILFKVFAERNLIGVTGLLCFVTVERMAEPEQTKKSMGQLFHSQFSVCLLFLKSISLIC